jgi:hypothetical protein
MGIDKILLENIGRQIFCTGDIAYAVWCIAEALKGSHHLPFGRGIKESNLLSYSELSSGHKPKRLCVNNCRGAARMVHECNQRPLEVSAYDVGSSLSNPRSLQKAMKMGVAQQPNGLALFPDDQVRRNDLGSYIVNNV